ncbi:PREDICTED: stAR-related lipid transfer protein 3-like [Amphimedon queenslandica]|uniref:START domain-containing protein n=1 Tax=Amphimedon queenslandica TaxID=400682 RepID=A0A1X7UU93_AMPQE|nr:PREDICTED: stAR-related lipid transfer protein 3-like [Amphimedon queenslandica]|eukprot:XP_003386712.1 PREDICTED: stAR-related lipid transfer protein 3-like [Amphimedon queenslandica]
MEGHHLLDEQTAEDTTHTRQLESSLGPRYGTVLTGTRSNQSGVNGNSRKRFRLSLLIVMSFDATLLAFLSILSYLTLESGSPFQTYFTNFDIKTSVFDIVVIAIIRFVILFLFYLVLGWVTRIVFVITIVVSTFYVPVKAYFFWTYLNAKDNTDIHYIIVLIFLFAAFVMPWLITFFFEFKFLPAELSRLSTTSWKNCKVWFCPWMLVKRPSEHSARPAHRSRTAIPNVQPLARYSSMDTVFRTPLGSIRGSPAPLENEDIVIIREDRTYSPVLTPLPECDQFSNENEGHKLHAMNAVEKLEQMTRSNNGWILEKEENGIRCFSYRSESNSRKIWKSEVVINIAVETLWRVLYHETHRTTEWNTNVDINKVLHHIDRTTDIVYTATKSVSLVTARDFVTVRKASVRRGCYYCASVSVVFNEKPPVPDKIRGENGPGGYVLIPLDSSKTLFKWVIDSDLKGWIPQSIIDQNFTSTLTSANNNLRLLITSHN